MIGIPKLPPGVVKRLKQNSIPLDATLLFPIRTEKYLLKPLKIYILKACLNKRDLK